jgi:hypothetical protein
MQVVTQIKIRTQKLKEENNAKFQKHNKSS